MIAGLVIKVVKLVKKNMKDKILHCFQVGRIFSLSSKTICPVLNYICGTILALRLVLTCDPLEDRRINDVSFVS